MSRSRRTGGSEVPGLLRSAVRAGLTPGAVAAWGQGRGDPNRVAVGLASVVPGRSQATVDTWYDLASLTKPLVVTTLSLIIIRRGEMSLRSQLQDLLPVARGRPLAAVTLAQLLSHSSGLPAWRPLYALASSPQGVLEAILSLELESRPGSRVVYSCLDFVLLGLILELVAGAPLDQLFSRLVIEPLGLREELGFRPDPGRRAVAGDAARPTAEQRMTQQTGADPASVPKPARGRPDDGNARFLGGVAGNAGLFGSASGVYHLCREYLDGSVGLLTADERRAAITARTGPVGEDVHGLGWQLATSPRCSSGPALAGRAFGHTGYTGTSAWVDPERKAVLVLLANRHHPGHRDVDLHPCRRRFHRVAVEDLV